MPTPTQPSSTPTSGEPAAEPGPHDLRAVAAYLAASPTLEVFAADRIARDLELDFSLVAEVLEILGAGGEAELVSARPARQWRATTWTPQVVSGRTARATGPTSCCD